MITEYYIRELNKDDFIKINAWRNDPSIIDHLGSPFRYVAPSIDQAWLESYLSNRNNNIRLAICHEDSGIVGAAYLLNINWVSRNAEFAIWIGEKAHQGKGLGRFIAHKVLTHAFNDMNLHRIYLTLLLNNERALSLYKRIGFREEGVHREAIYKNGSYMDMIQMSILKEEFVSK